MDTKNHLKTNQFSVCVCYYIIYIYIGELTNWLNHKLAESIQPKGLGAVCDIESHKLQTETTNWHFGCKNRFENNH